MKLEEISVESYSGYKHAQRPLSFKLGDRTIEILEIARQELIEDISMPGTRKQLFVVKGDDKKTYKLHYLIASDEWFALI